MRDHGTHACYVVDRCRCDPCREASRIYGIQRRSRTVPPYVDATETRSHIEWLATQGVGLKTIAAASGVAHGTLWKLVYGPAGREPSKRIRPGTASKILAVMPSAAADGARIDAAATRDRVEELIAAGMPVKQICDRVEIRYKAMHTLRFGRGKVTARTARNVAALHAEYTAGTLTYERRTRWGTETVTVPVDDLADRMRRYHQKAHRARYDDSRRQPYIDDGDRFVDEMADTIEATFNRDWVQRAACRGKPAWMWHPASSDLVTIAAAKAICDCCPVRRECLTAGISERDGIYGGLTFHERARLRVEQAS